MGTDHHHLPPHRCPPRCRRLTGRKSEGGHIVPVQGGHVVRSTGRKDRHSKVCTAKGPRDRRVRLSAHTAIQFYDVQDRLGYDRPSKAVDWLIENARAAIDDLAELPPWKPTTTDAAAAASSSQGDQEVQNPQRTAALDYASCSAGLLPPSLDGDAIADTIKSFFPMADTAGSASSYQQSQVEDLRLSLQSFHAPVLLHDQPQPTTIEQSIFSSSVPAHLAYDHPPPSSWPYDGGGAGGYDFMTRPLDPTLIGGSYLAHQQREPLQSSSLPASMRGWADPIRQTWSYAAIGFEPGGFSRFFVPERFQGVDDSDGSSNYHPNDPSSVPPF